MTKPANPSHKASLLEVVGMNALNLKSSCSFIAEAKVPLDQFFNRLVFIGYESMPMLLILTAIATMILTLNTSVELIKQGGRELIGALIAVADIREIVPVFIAFAIAARCGTAITAEVASMKVSDQIDVLGVLRISPVYFLIVPVLLSVIILAPFLLAIAAVFSIFSGMITAKLVVDLEMIEFLSSAWKVLDLKEYFYALIKTEIFLIYALLTNLTMGLNCKGGAREVGMTTTKATAYVVIGIIVLDGILTPIFN